VDSVLSHDCAKTIPILDTNGFAILPHLVYKDFQTLKTSIKHIKNYQTLLRHFDLKEVTSFIIYVNKNVDLKDRFKIDNYFEEIADINVISIKQYYLKLLTTLKDVYTEVYDYFQDKRKAVHESTIKLTTSDAYTLTGGPTIYMAREVEKIAKFCLNLASIPAEVLDIIMEGINSNDLLRQEINILDRQLAIMDDVEEPSKKKSSKNDRTQKTKKLSRNTPTDMDTKKKDLQRQMDGLRGNLIKIELDKEFVPNTLDHLKKYFKSDFLGKSFTSDIPESAVEKIMLLEVDPIWKVLLLMGIGVFTEHTSRDYVAIMKDLAQNQQLYLIIASTDYIYGTNYQFCHGYIGKDLKDLTQEKLIQALGRTGRQNTKMEYSIRLRDEEFINTLFMPSTNKVEVNNMNRLFG
jgi:flagellar biosynthesis regulator FlaF